MFKELDPILHSQLRLAVMSLLISVKEAEFTFLKEKTNSTAGNISVQINKLKEAGYIDVNKKLHNKLQKVCYQLINPLLLPSANGEMAEWSNAAVLKTVDCYRSVGSNPTLSADNNTLCVKAFKTYVLRAFFMSFISNNIKLYQTKGGKSVTVIIFLSCVTRF